MKNIIKKEWLKRALRTFAQTAVGYIAVNIAVVDWEDTSTLKTVLVGLCISAVSAGLAAIMNANLLKDESEE